MRASDNKMKKVEELVLVGGLLIIGIFLAAFAGAGAGSHLVSAYAGAFNALMLVLAKRGWR